MANTRLISLLLDLLDRARTAERTLYAGLSDEERPVPGTFERWSAKDLVAHLTHWHGFLASLLTAAMRGETPARTAGFDEVNARVYAESQAKSWEQVWGEADEAVARLTGLLPQLTDEDLTDPARYPWRHGSALAPAVVRPTYWHPMIHLGDYYAQRGDMGGLKSILDDLTTGAGDLSPWPELRGQTLCFVALAHVGAGQPAEARAALAEGLSLAPGMTQWAQHDPVLFPLLANG